jgi:hypothetical protein
MEISGASTIFKYIMFSSILNIYQFGFYFLFLTTEPAKHSFSVLTSTNNTKVCRSFSLLNVLTHIRDHFLQLICRQYKICLILIYLRKQNL